MNRPDTPLERRSKVEWAAFTFPPLNLWNMPLHNEIVQLINKYYYEHYRHLWEEGQEEKRYDGHVTRNLKSDHSI